ncbi:hypothetical protein TNCV_99801 [Trichonephila clavipes]|nr:hypothetical protein TNCV_99801 [Trichonephila clavipes]
MAQHRPRKPAPVEYVTDEEDMIVYDVTKMQSNRTLIMLTRWVKYEAEGQVAGFQSINFQLSKVEDAEGTRTSGLDVDAVTIDEDGSVGVFIVLAEESMTSDTGVGG